MRLAKIIHPQGDKILVLPKKAETKTNSGLITKINEKTGKKPQQGEVLAISDYLSHIWSTSIFGGIELPMSFIVPERKTNGIAPGDVVLFTDYAGDDIDIKDLDSGDLVTVKVLSVEHVLGLVIDPEEKEIIPPPPETHAS